MDGDPADEQLNDLASLGVPRGPPPGAHGSPRAYPPRRHRQAGHQSGSRTGQSVIQHPEFLFHVGGDGVGTRRPRACRGCRGRWRACGEAVTASRSDWRCSEARSASATALGLDGHWTLGEELIDEVLRDRVRKRDTSDQTAASSVSPLIEAPMHFASETGRGGPWSRCSDSEAPWSRYRQKERPQTPQRMRERSR